MSVAAAFARGGRASGTAATAAFARRVRGRGAPATTANLARNALRDADRADRWIGARDAAWAVLDRRVAPGAHVAVVGAGHSDDLPLGRLLDRAARVDLYDLDAPAMSRAVRRQPAARRRCAHVCRCDVTGGAADAVARAICRGGAPGRVTVPGWPLGNGGYDVVIGDLFYSQLLYPALVDAGVTPAAVDQALTDHGATLTDGVVARLHASVAPGGCVVHLHDLVGWWPGHGQPVSLEDILAAPDTQQALALAARCRQPTGADPRLSACRLGAPVTNTALWEWPFGEDARYLVCAAVSEIGMSE